MLLFFVFLLLSSDPGEEEEAADSVLFTFHALIHPLPEPQCCLVFVLNSLHELFSIVTLFLLARSQLLLVLSLTLTRTGAHPTVIRCGHPYDSRDPPRQRESDIHDHAPSGLTE